MARLPASTNSEGLLRWRGEYQAGTEYAKNDAVKYGGGSYVSIVEHNTGHAPSTSPTQWELLAQEGTGSPSADFFEHKQETASVEWKIKHGLGKKPSILVKDTGNNVIEPDIEYPTLNEAIAKFAALNAGTAYCN